MTDEQASAARSTEPCWSADADRWATPGPPPPRADLLVVGLGAAGLAAARRAAARGARVVGVDAGRIGGGASGSNGGFLLAGAADPHHVCVRRWGSRRATALYERTLQALAAERAERPGALLTRGSIRLAADDAERADCAEQAAAMRLDGLEVEQADGPWGDGLWFPHDAGMDPGRRCAALAAAAHHAGASLHAGVGVQRIEAGRAATSVGDLHASRILVAVDGGLEHLVAGLGVRTVRNQVLATGPDAVPPDLVPAPVYARWGYDYWQRRADGGVVVGGARDRGGPAEETAADGTTAVVQAALERILRDHLQSTARVTHRWSGAFGVTPERVPRCRLVAEGDARVAVAGGYSGVGNLLGPVCGVAAVGLLLDGHHPDADLVDPPASGLG